MTNEDLEINIIYNINNENIRIFGYEFVKNNRKNCKMIIHNKEYEINEYYNIKNYSNNKIRVKLKGIHIISNMSNMFFGCSSLISLPDISKLNTNNVTNMSFCFVDAHHYRHYLIFQDGIFIMLLICVLCLMNAHHYHLCLIFQNGIQIMLMI